MTATDSRVLALSVLVLALSRADSRPLNRHLQYASQAAANDAAYTHGAGAAAASSPDYGGQAAAQAAYPVQHVQVANMKVMYSTPERLDIQKAQAKGTKYNTPAAAHYNRGETTVYHEHHEPYDCKFGYAAAHTATGYAAPAQAYAHTEAKTGHAYRKLSEAEREARLLMGYDDCPEATTKHDWTMLYLFCVLVVVTIVVWCCCKCFDGWCMWHTKPMSSGHRGNQSPVDMAMRKRQEQAAQLQEERNRQGMSNWHTSIPGISFAI